MDKKKVIEQVKTFSIDLVYDIVGGFLYAVAVNMFSSPNRIAPGGVTGIATLINYIFGAPIGTVTMLINIPLLLISYKVLGKLSTLRTLKSLLIMTIMVDVVTISIPPYKGDMILACIFAGVLMGLGHGMVFLRGSTTGGSDIVNRLIKIRLPHISIGRLGLCFDTVVLILAAIVYGNIENALYAMIAMYVSSKMTDSLIYGLDKGKLLYIISDRSPEIGKEIIKQLGRGATLLNATGLYSDKERRIVFCAVRNHQYPAVKKIAYNIDPYAFIIITDAGEILGQGFRKIEEN
ncbi:MAG: YitT family protein [Oscillospiraceae bacterium]